MRTHPESQAIKYWLVGSSIGFVVILNVLLGKISDSIFMNFFWAIVFSSIYFNRRTVIFAVLASITSYIAIVWLIPDLRPVGFQSIQAAVIMRLFYLCIVGSGSVTITVIANNLWRRISDEETNKLEALNEVNNLLKEIAISGNTLSTATDELRSYTEETSASMMATNEIVHNLATDATNSREGTAKAQQLLNTLAERTQSHQNLTERTVQLTENIVTTAASGSESVSIIQQEIQQVVLQFGNTLETIEELNQDSQNIGEIVQTISNIAEQTKMLSMNASIEAARAGEFGRGFAVVATKINKLSIQSQETLKQIDAIIKKFLPQLEMTVTRSKETSVVFEKGIQGVYQINESFIQIVHTLQEGLPLLQEVSSFLTSQSEIINEIGTEVTNAYDFSVASEDGMKNLNDIINELTNMAQTVTNSTQQMSNLAETFTTQAKLRFSEEELLQSEVEKVAEKQSQEAVQSIIPNELPKSDFDESDDLDDLDEYLDSITKSLSGS